MIDTSILSQLHSMYQTTMNMDINDIKTILKPILSDFISESDIEQTPPRVLQLLYSLLKVNETFYDIAVQIDSRSYNPALINMLKDAIKGEMYRRFGDGKQRGKTVAKD